MALLKYSFFARFAATTPDGRWHDLSDIVVESREICRKRGFTGIMITDEEMLFVSLEGDDMLLDQWFRETLADTRLSELDITEYGPAEDRVFGDWDVHFRPVARPGRAVIDHDVVEEVQLPVTTVVHAGDPEPIIALLRSH